MAEPLELRADPGRSMLNVVPQSRLLSQLEHLGTLHYSIRTRMRAVVQTILRLESAADIQ